MDSFIDNMAKGSPLIQWLLNKLPILGKSLVIALIITWLTGAETLQVFAYLFVVTIVITGYAPNILASMEHGLGFALAAVLLGFTFLKR
jgi:hypothetical protein